jgi:hypothetical protein
MSVCTSLGLDGGQSTGLLVFEKKLRMVVRKVNRFREGKSALYEGEDGGRAIVLFPRLQEITVLLQKDCRKNSWNRLIQEK